MSVSSYFDSLAAYRHRLRLHGLSDYPTEAEVAERIIELDDKIAALCSFLGVELERRWEGMWAVAVAVAPAGGAENGE